MLEVPIVLLSENKVGKLFGTISRVPAQVVWWQQNKPQKQPKMEQMTTVKNFTVKRNKKDLRWQSNVLKGDSSDIFSCNFLELRVWPNAEINSFICKNSNTYFVVVFEVTSSRKSGTRDSFTFIMPIRRNKPLNQLLVNPEWSKI